MTQFNFFILISLIEVSKSLSTNNTPPYISLYSQLPFLFIHCKILFANLTVPRSTRCRPSVNRSESKILSFNTKCVSAHHSDAHNSSRIRLTDIRFSCISTLHFLKTIPEKTILSTPYLIHVSRISRIPKTISAAVLLYRSLVPQCTTTF